MIRSIALIGLLAAHVGYMQARVTLHNKTPKSILVKIDLKGINADFPDWKIEQYIQPNKTFQIPLVNNTSFNKLVALEKSEAHFSPPSKTYHQILLDPKYNLVVNISINPAGNLALDFPPTLEELIKILDVRNIVPKSVKEQTIPDIVGEPRKRLEQDLKITAQQEGKSEHDYVKAPPKKELREIIADYLINVEDED